MFDILAAIQSADPPSLVLWSLFAFAAGMYPLGFMLGASCSPCCGQCDLCATGSLPDTVTVTFSGIPESVYWVDVEFTACHGSGAFARASESSAESPYPITAVEVLDGGSGYALKGRVAPTVTVTGSGSGATFTPTLTKANDACGVPSWKISSVAVSGGTGYTHGEQLTVQVAAGDTVAIPAVLTLQAERSQPTLSASVSGGTGATLTPTLAANGTTPQTWGVQSVSVSGTTSGYTDGASVTFSYGAGVTEQAAAVATIKTARATPTITASVSGGSGASLTVNLSQSPTTPSDTALWHVDSVTVADGGTGYADGDAVTFTVTDGAQVTAASGTIATSVVRENPNLTPYVWGADGTTAGSGAVLSATMVSNEDDPETWGVAAINVIDGGSGYEVGEYFWYSEFGTGFASIPPYYLVETDGWLITSVDENGAITGVGLDGYGGIGKFYKATGNGVIQSVTITNGGDYYKATTSIARVVVTNGGQYYYYTGVPTGVTITNGGEYYREDASLPPYVADVTATVVDRRPYGTGTGAQVAATVDANTGSATFGRITAVTITNDGGTGYVASEHNYNCCGQFFNDRSIVLRRPASVGAYYIEAWNTRCTYTHSVCSNIVFGEYTNLITAHYDGPSSPPRVTIYGNSGSFVDRQDEVFCLSRFYSDTLVSDCDDLSFTATDYRGATATVTAGGEYDPEYANQDCLAKGSICCGRDSDPPDEIDVEVRDFVGGQWVPPSGLPAVPVVVLSLNGTLGAGPLFGAVNYFAHGRDAIQWQGQMPGSGSGGVTRNLAVRVQTCGEACDEPECATSCETTARAQDFSGPLNSSQEAESEPCQGCAAIPQCSPVAGEFVLEIDGSPWRKLTIL
jgi:hypothetical protein